MKTVAEIDSHFRVKCYAAIATPRKSVIFRIGTSHTEIKATCSDWNRNGMRLPSPKSLRKCENQAKRPEAIAKRGASFGTHLLKTR